MAKDDNLIVERMDKTAPKYEPRRDLAYGYAWVLLFGLVGAAVILLAVFGDGK
jgi:hypothetical protein